MIGPARPLLLALAAAVGLAGCAQSFQKTLPQALTVARTVLPTADPYTCAESVDLNVSSRLLALTPREAKPKTDARQSEELAAHARLSGVAYLMFNAFERGEDLGALLPSELAPVAFIYGSPGPSLDRSFSELRPSRTFFGYIADDLRTGVRFVVFRGTLQPMEWVRNIQAVQTPFATGGGVNAFVHSGFLRIYGSLELEQRGTAQPTARPLSSALPKLLGARDTVFIGHSLGGALATLAGVDASRRAPSSADRIRVTTFASPRVGDPGFAQLARSVGRIDRVCNVVDPVTEAPASTGATTYTHVGEVFPISSFDWPGLDNAINDPRRQVFCWHTITTYRYMLSPSRSTFGLGSCLK